MLAVVPLLALLGSTLADKPVPNTNSNVNKHYQFFRNKDEIHFLRPVHKYYNIQPAAGDRQQRVLPQQQHKQQQHGRPLQQQAYQLGRSFPQHQQQQQLKPQPVAAQQQQREEIKIPPQPFGKQQVRSSQQARNIPFPQNHLRKDNQVNQQQRAAAQQHGAIAQPAHGVHPRVVNKRPRKIDQTPIKQGKNSVSTNKLENNFKKAESVVNKVPESKAESSNVVVTKVKPSKKPAAQKKTVAPKPAKVTPKPAIDNRDYKVTHKPKFIIKQAGKII